MLVRGSWHDAKCHATISRLHITACSPSFLQHTRHQVIALSVRTFHHPNSYHLALSCARVPDHLGPRVDGLQAAVQPAAALQSAHSACAAGQLGGGLSTLHSDQEGNRVRPQDF